jgi:hypothetical protein
MLRKERGKKKSEVPRKKRQVVLRLRASEFDRTVSRITSKSEGHRLKVERMPKQNEEGMFWKRFFKEVKAHCCLDGRMRRSEKPM